jgi:membrane protein
VSRNQAFDVAAQMAYMALLAIFPFMIFVLTVIGYLPLGDVDRELMAAVYRVMPREAAALFDATLHEVLGQQRGLLLVLSLLGGLWTAAGGVGTLIGALNRAWGVVETRPFWKIKLEAIVITGLGGLLTVVAIGATVIGPGVAHRLSAWFGLGAAFDTAWGYLRWPLSVLAMMMLLAAVYWVLPNFKHRFRLVSPGSAFAVLAWMGASAVFNGYVSHFNSYARTYGTLGAAVVLLTWLYISGLVVIFGGEINAALARLGFDRGDSVAAVSEASPARAGG